MHTGAMGSQRIFTEEFEASLLPHTLHANLLRKARANLANSTSITRQYNSKVAPIDRPLTEDALSAHLLAAYRGDKSPSTTISPDGPSATPHSDRGGGEGETPVSGATRKRTESLVKFADGFDTTGHQQQPPQGDLASVIHLGNRRSTPISAASLSAGLSENRRLAPPPPRPILPDKRNAASNSTDLTQARDGSGSQTSESMRSNSSGSNHELYFEKWLTTDASASAAELPDDRLIMDGIESPSGPGIRSRDSSRSASRASSVADESLLTEEEKFDKEYGEFFSHAVETGQSSSGDGDHHHHHHHHHHLNGTAENDLLRAEEQQQLLTRSNDDDRGGTTIWNHDYSSFSDDQERKKDKHWTIK